MRYLVLLTVVFLSSPCFADVLVRKNNNVTRFDPVTGQQLGSYILPDAFGPAVSYAGELIGPEGLLYALFGTGDTSDLDGVMRFDPITGAGFDTLAAPWATTGGNARPEKAVFGPDGDFYVMWHPGVIAKFNGASGETIKQSFAIAGSGLADFDFGPDGDIYATLDSNEDHLVARFDSQTGALIEILQETFINEDGDPQLRDILLPGAATDFLPDGTLVGSSHVVSGDGPWWDSSCRLFPSGRLYCGANQVDPDNGNVLRTFAVGGLWTSEPVPEPSTALVACIALGLMGSTRARL